MNLMQVTLVSRPACGYAGCPAFTPELLIGNTYEPEVLCEDLPRGVTESDIFDSLQFHDNRYAWLGSALQRTSTRFGWEAVALAEIRDLNRHRTGTKWCPLVPKGFYSALDQLPPQFADEHGEQLREVLDFFAVLC